MFCPLIREELIIEVCPIKCMYRHSETRRCVYKEVKELVEGDVEGYALVTGRKLSRENLDETKEKVRCILIADRYREYSSIKDPSKWNQKHYELWRYKNSIDLEFKDVVEYGKRLPPSSNKS